MISAIMKLYILTRVSIHSVISEVRRVTSFTASKELPNSSTEALSLWISKINNHNIHKMKGLREVQKSPSHVTNRNVLEVVRDGQSLASLLCFYLPNSVKWNGKCKSMCGSLALIILFYRLHQNLCLLTRIVVFQLLVYACLFFSIG